MLKYYCISICIIFISLLSAYSIDETLMEISIEKEAMARDNVLCENKIAELRNNDPDFLPQDMFESDIKYLMRICKSAPKIIAIRDQYIKPHLENLNCLRKTIIGIEDIKIELDSYDANTEKYSLFITSEKYPHLNCRALLSIPSDEARFLYENFDKFVYVACGYISYDDTIAISYIDIYNLKEDPICHYEVDTLKPYYFYSDFSYSDFSYDGEIFACSNNKSVYVLKTLPDSTICLYKNNFPNKINCISLSPEGKYLAVGAYGIEPTKKDFWLINVQTKEVILSESFDGGIYSVDISPDGRLVAVGGGFSYTNSDARIYDIETGKMLWDFSGYECIKGVKFSPNQKYIANIGKELNVYDLTTLDKVINVSTSNCFFALDFSPDSNILVVGGKYEGFAFYDMNSKMLTNSYENNKHVYSLSFDFTGKLLAVGYEDLKIISLKAMLYEREFKTFGGLYKPGSIYVVSHGKAYISFYPNSAGYEEY